MKCKIICVPIAGTFILVTFRRIKRILRKETKNKKIKETGRRHFLILETDLSQQVSSRPASVKVCLQVPYHERLTLATLRLLP